MANGQQPSWVGGAIAFFAVCTAVAFGFFVHFYTMDSHLSEKRIYMILEEKELGKQVDILNSQRQPLADEVAAKQLRLSAITVNSSDSKSGNKNLLDQQRVRISELESVTHTIDRDFKTAIKTAKDARMEMLEQEKNMLTSGADLEAKLINYRAQIKNESRAVEAFQKKTREDLHSIERGNSSLTKRVEALSGQQELNRSQLRSDGKVLTARSTDGYLVMDIGRDTGLRVGTVFKVFARSGGKNIEKGTAEVTHVGATQSQARILTEIDKTEPIIPGDSLHNPVFNPDEVKIFVLSGIFASFTKQELARFITEAGGKVEQALSTNTHYLVAGDGSDNSITEASKFGIHIISEDQLIDFIRPQHVRR